MSDFEITGSIKYTTNKPRDFQAWVKENEPLHVQAWDKDQGLLEERNDDLLGISSRKSDGTFNIGFGKKQYDETLNFLREGQPDIFLIIRNKLGEIIHTTPVRRGVNPSKKKNLTFNITLNLENLENKVQPKEDPFSDTMNMRLAAFQSFGQRADFADDLQRSFTLLLSTINAWAGYSNELSWRTIGYDGALVKRFPWRTKHNHKVKWKK